MFQTKNCRKLNHPLRPERRGGRNPSRRHHSRLRFNRKMENNGKSLERMVSLKVVQCSTSYFLNKDWEHIKFGVDNKVDFYAAVSVVKNGELVRELKDYLKSCDADIHVIGKIESADSIAMVACGGDLGAELPIVEILLL